MSGATLPAMGRDAVAGWYPVAGGYRWWDGTVWTEHFRQPMPPINHILHLLLVVLTFGAWGLLWAYLSWDRSRRMRWRAQPPV